MNAREELAGTIAESFGWDWKATPEEHIPSAVECCEDSADAIIAAGWVNVDVIRPVALGDWCVYESAHGVSYSINPATEENARREANLAGEGHEAVPVVLAAHLTNALAYGRMHGHRQAAALRGEA